MRRIPAQLINMINSGLFQWSLSVIEPRAAVTPRRAGVQFRK